ncbi:MAG: ECF transporter S component [Clostridia bacterium]|nr:ECF transporter S component [Clostridia bacterium]
MSNIKKMVFTALLIALGVVLPMALHGIPNAGMVLLPMHIPVLLCGILCGFPYGLACGILTPLLSSLATGMPPAAILPAMVCELAVYGAVSSLLMRYIRMKNVYAKITISLIGAMLAGRLVFGVLNALIFQAGNYSMHIWVTSAFVTALPGIAIQLVLIPAIYAAFVKARLVQAEN